MVFNGEEKGAKEEEGEKKDSRGMRKKDQLRVGDKESKLKIIKIN